jgi:hypothetical protein
LRRRDFLRRRGLETGPPPARSRCWFYCCHNIRPTPPQASQRSLWIGTSGPHAGPAADPLRRKLILSTHPVATSRPLTPQRR